MERLIYIEVLDRRGRVRERVRLDRLPAVVGRAYGGDVIIEDRFVSPEHCRIRESESGGILVEDCGSLNGVIKLPEAERVSSLAVQSGDRFRIGETVIRLVDAAHAVPAAEPLPRDEGGLLHRLRSARIARSVIAACVLAIAAHSYLGAYYDSSWMAWVNPTLVAFVLLGLWAGIWSFANRLLTHRFDFDRHFAVAALAAVSALLAATIADYAEFVTSWESLRTAIELAGIGTIVAALLAAHLAIIPESSKRRRRLSAAAAGAVLVVIVALINYEESEQAFSEIHLDVPLKPILGNNIPAVTEAEFLERARWVREAVDEKAREELR
jgi:hypothetical protein